MSICVVFSKIEDWIFESTDVKSRERKFLSERYTERVPRGLPKKATRWGRSNLGKVGTQDEQEVGQNYGQPVRLSV